MRKFSFSRERDQEFKHITRGLIPAASIAAKPAVPRTPPPRSPNPSPERPRSALAAAILSSSLTGQTWAIPPARPRSFSESGQTESFISEPNFGAALYTRDRWSEDSAHRPHLSSSDHSEEEFGINKEEEEEENEEDKDEHVYQTLDTQGNCSITEPIYALPLKLKSSTPQPNQMSGRREPSPVFTEESRAQSPEASCEPAKRKASITKSSESQTVVEPDRFPCLDVLPNLTTEHPIQPSNAKKPKLPTQLSAEPRRTYREVQREIPQPLPEKSIRAVDDQKLLEERLQQLEHEINHSEASPNLRSSAGTQAELWNWRRHAQELVDENDALKLTVHRLNLELSQYQFCFRPLSKQKDCRVYGLPKTGSPPPWLHDMKYLSPLLLAYEDRMNEKDTLLQTTELEVKRLRDHVEEVIKENERLHVEIAKFGGVNQEDCHQLQEQAFLVLQENQVLIDQLETQHAKAKATLVRHHYEVSKLTKHVMLLESEKDCLVEDLQKSSGEEQKHLSEVQVLQAHLKDVITWDEHCRIAGKLRRLLEKQESSNRSEMDNLILRFSSLQEENRSLALDKANLTADLKKTETEMELERKTNRKAVRRMSVLEQQKQECVITEEKTRNYMGAVISVAEFISKERDQLLQMASVLQQEKQEFVNRLVNGTVRYGKLQQEVKVYRKQASARLAVLEESVEGRTASYQREILRLQRLLSERQKAEERLLQSKREVEEELDIVWQAADKQKQRMKETLLNSKLPADFQMLTASNCAGDGWPSKAPDEVISSTQTQPQQSEPLVLKHQHCPELQRKGCI